MNAEQVDAEQARDLARLRSPQALLRAALWYVECGIAVFPLLPGTKLPATAHGFKDAQIDKTWVRLWWKQWPQANIGLPTGHQFDVIDVDPPDGWASLDELRAQDMVPTALGFAATARGGEHIYVVASGQGNRAGMLPGIDYRGLGGYVVAPPSRSEVGMWTWTEPLMIGWA